MIEKEVALKLNLVVQDIGMIDHHKEKGKGKGKEKEIGTEIDEEIEK